MPRFSSSSAWYHVTYSGRLPYIAERGLRRGQPRSIGAPALDSHAAKGVFLTLADGVFFWHGRAEAFAEHNSDDFVEDELIPVVLRVDLPDDLPREGDAEGTRDALVDAIVVRAVHPMYLNVWTGTEWVPIDQYDEVNLDCAYTTMVEDDAELHYFVNDSPLVPPECRP